MDAARIELKLALDEAGIPEPKLETFSERLNVQKRIYLIQVLGCDLGYRFSWYLRGPYSRQLTNEAFALRQDLDAGDREADSFLLAPEPKEKIERARKLWELPSDVTIDQDRWLELLASLHYLAVLAYWPTGANKSFDAVFDKLIEYKPQFRSMRNAGEQAWRRLAEFNMLSELAA